MDFALLASDNNNLNAAAFSLQNAAADASKQKCYGFGFLKQERAVNEEDTREFKMAKTCSSSSSCGEGVLRYPLHRSNGCNLSSAEGQQQHHQMLSFSSPNSQPPPLTLPYYHYTSNAFSRINAGINGGSMQQQGQGVRGPFTPSQWMELEHQALIYKYISANVPIPSYLLNPIRKAFQSVAAGFSALRSNPPLGWSGFQLGFSNSDPEPGRCRRTDGKKWRCSRDAVVDQKYCERHMNRGRHRSRKPVEPPQTNPPTIPTTTTYKINAGADKQPNAAMASSKVEAAAAKGGEHYRSSNAFQESRPEFGLVCSDSLLNPLNRTSSLRQFMDDWPKNQTDRSEPDRTQLSISIPMVTSDLMSSTSSPTNHNNSRTPSDPHRLSRELEMGLGVGNIDAPNLNQRTTSWVPISWEPTSIGGPLGEVLHNTNTNTNTKQLNLMDNWDHSPRRLASSPTGVLQRGAFASLSNSSAASSPRHDGSTQCNVMLINPSLPAL